MESPQFIVIAEFSTGQEFICDAWGTPGQQCVAWLDHLWKQAEQEEFIEKHWRAFVV